MLTTTFFYIIHVIMILMKIHFLFPYKSFVNFNNCFMIFYSYNFHFIH
jgi:hypothetical protein